MAEVVTYRELVTVARAAALTNQPKHVIRHLVRVGKIEAKACSLMDRRRSLLYELWEVQAALDDLRPFRGRVAAP